MNELKEIFRIKQTPQAPQDEPGTAQIYIARHEQCEDEEFRAQAGMVDLITETFEAEE